MSVTASDKRRDMDFKMDEDRKKRLKHLENLLTSFKSDVNVDCLLVRVFTYCLQSAPTRKHQSHCYFHVSNDVFVLLVSSRISLPIIGPENSATSRVYFCCRIVCKA